MAVNSRTSTELLMPKHKWTPESTRSSSSSCRKLTYDQAGDFAPLAGNAVVPVVYYISRNGKLEHPHFVMVPVSSSSDGLYLRDVLNRLNMLRGNSMAYKYSWSSKRKYKSNGYVWQDLSEDDLIYPTNDDDYVLKGSEIPKNTLSFRLTQPNVATHCDNSSNTLSTTTTTRPTNQSFSTTNFQNAENHRNEETNRVYKCKSSRQLGEQLADAATQTDDRWKLKEDDSVELSREELSPPPSTKSSSADGMDGGGVSGYVDSGQLNQPAKNESGTRRIAQRLMRMISCKSSDSTKCYNSIENVSQEFLCNNVQKGVARNKRRL